MAQFRQDLREIQAPIQLPAPPVGVTFNEWFLSLVEGRQAILRDDKWMLADNAFEAGKVIMVEQQLADRERIKELEAELGELTADRDIWKERASLMLRLKHAETGRADELLARLDGAEGAAKLKSQARYILLKDGDVVGPDDEFLRDDAASWCINGPRSSWLGAIFNSGFHMPMRRKVTQSMEEGIVE